MNGVSLLILSQLMWAVATVVGKKLLAQTSPLLFTAIALFISSVMFLPVLFTSNFNKDIKPFVTQNFIPIIIYVVFWLVLGEFVFNTGLSKVSPVVATLITLTLPLFTTIISIIFLGETLNIKILVGAALIASGVTVLAR